MWGVDCTLAAKQQTMTIEDIFDRSRTPQSLYAAPRLDCDPT